MMRRGSGRAARVLSVSFLCVLVGHLTAISQVGTVGLRTNLELFRSLSEQIADSVAAELPQHADTLSVSFAQTGESIPVQERFLSALKSAGKRVFLDTTVTGPNVMLVRFAPEMKVAYSQIGSVGVLGEAKFERTLMVRTDVRVVGASSREVVYSGTRNAAAVDTLSDSEIALVETPGYPATHATLPEGGVLDKLVEPIVILGSVGAMIFLFFHVRS